MSRPRIPLGRDALSNAIRWLLEQDERRKIIKSPDVSPEETVRGTALRINAVKGGAEASEPGSSIQRFEVQTIFADYLSCRKMKSDGTYEDSIIYYVAKPSQIMASFSRPPAGFTAVNSSLGNSRVLTYAGATVGDLIAGMTVNEILHPLYFAGDSELYATQPTGGIGTSTGLLDPNGDRITWIDINISARVFRPQYLGTAICTGNIAKRVIVAGGPTGATI